MKGEQSSWENTYLRHNYMCPHRCMCAHIYVSMASSSTLLYPERTL